MPRLVDGSVIPLILIKRVIPLIPLEYCPVASEDYYFLDYTILLPFRLIDYCPQDTTDFYTFSSPPE